MTTQEFCELLKQKGFDFFAGVPCSILKEIILYLEQDPEVTYIAAVREDAAVGVAVGAYLSGRRPMVLMQNSGLGVCATALTSLAAMYRIPLLCLVTWRGYEGQDEPEHLLMGRAMLRLLDDLEIPYRVLEPDQVEASVEETLALLEDVRKPVAMVLRRGVLS